jgi:tRNA A-37 threonylcarbamoyl transferase component Bud32
VPIPTLEERLSTTVAERYLIERLIAKGGMSVVFAARDIRAHRPVALKLLKPSDCLDEQRIARFLRETELTARLRHPHVVDVLDLGREPDGTPFLVMELLRGNTLAAELADNAVVPWQLLLRWTLPLMDALSCVHDAGIVHRDLKPDNVFLARDAHGVVTPKLLDFGIAKSTHASSFTRTGAVLGTPEYMAPEQLAGMQVSATTDVWGLGALLFRALSGSAPYAAGSAAAVLTKLSCEPAPLLHAANVPAQLRASIDRALFRDPAHRYPDIRSFAHALILAARSAGLALPDDALRVPQLTAAAPLAQAAQVAQTLGGAAPAARARIASGLRFVPVSRVGLAALVALAGLALAPTSTQPLARQAQPAHAAAPVPPEITLAQPQRVMVTPLLADTAAAPSPLGGELLPPTAAVEEPAAATASPKRHVKRVAVREASTTQTFRKAPARAPATPPAAALPPLAQQW